MPECANTEVFPLPGQATLPPRAAPAAEPDVHAMAALHLGAGAGAGAGSGAGAGAGAGAEGAAAGVVNASGDFACWWMAMVALTRAAPESAPCPLPATPTYDSPTYDSPMCEWRFSLGPPFKPRAHARKGGNRAPGSLAWAVATGTVGPNLNARKEWRLRPLAAEPVNHFNPSGGVHLSTRAAVARRRERGLGEE